MTDVTPPVAARTPSDAVARAASRRGVVNLCANAYPGHYTGTTYDHTRRSRTVHLVAFDTSADAHKFTEAARAAEPDGVRCLGQSGTVALIFAEPDADGALERLLAALH